MLNKTLETLTKSKIAKAISDELGSTKIQAETLVETMLSLMKDALRKDSSLLISGFGKFEACEKNARRGRNPQTDEEIVLDPRRVLVFRLSKKFREQLNKSNTK
ncbi:MAG: integration host factor subunit alpha [Desulfovibrionaceae bacterium]